MLSQNFDFLAAIIPVLGCVSYARDTIKGKTKPSRVSWLLWALAPLIAFSAEIYQHTSFRVSLLAFAVGFGPLVVLVTSLLNRKAYWKLTKFDFLCGSISLLAIILWVITGKGDIAIIFSILADLFAAIPTMTKAYSHPKSESAAPFTTSIIGAGITLLTVKIWTLANFAFPLYIFLVCVVITLLIVVPRPTKPFLSER